MARRIDKLDRYATLYQRLMLARAHLDNVVMFHEDNPVQAMFAAELAVSQLHKIYLVLQETPIPEVRAVEP